MEITLSNGGVALIDDSDYPAIAPFKWRLSRRSGHYLYAVTSVGPHHSLLQLSMHRVVLQAPKGVHVDHINHNGLDNRRANLRLCRHFQNLGNQGLAKHNTSGFKGVHRTTSNRWRAGIQIRGRSVHLGTFYNPIDAARAYDDAASYYFGDFAWLNFPHTPFAQIPPCT